MDIRNEALLYQEEKQKSRKKKIQKGHKGKKTQELAPALAQGPMSRVKSGKKCILKLEQKKKKKNWNKVEGILINSHC